MWPGELLCPVNKATLWGSRAAKREGKDLKVTHISLPPPLFISVCLSVCVGPRTDRSCIQPCITCWPNSLTTVQYLFITLTSSAFYSYLQWNYLLFFVFCTFIMIQWLNLNEYWHKKQKKEIKKREKEEIENQRHAKEESKDKGKRDVCVCMHVCVAGPSVNLDLSLTPHK